MGLEISLIISVHVQDLEFELSLAIGIQSPLSRRVQRSPQLNFFSNPFRRDFISCALDGYGTVGFDGSYDRSLEMLLQFFG